MLTECNRDSVDAREGGDQLTPFCSTYHYTPGDNNRHHLQRTTVQQTIGNGAGKEFDDGAVPKYGTNPAYSAMINSSAIADFVPPSLTTSGYCSRNYCIDNSQFPVSSDTIPISPRLGVDSGVRLQRHGDRLMTQQQPTVTSSFPWHGGPEVVTERNCLFAYNVANRSTVETGNVTEMMADDCSVLKESRGETGGYNESLRSNASSVLDDHIYEIAG